MKITKETVRRTFRTFVQAALGYMLVHLSNVDFSDSRAALRAALTGVAVSAAAAGLSAVMNLEKEREEAHDDECLGEEQSRESD